MNVSVNIDISETPQRPIMTSLENYGSAEALFKQLLALTQSKSFQHLDSITNENAELRKKKMDWEITNRNNLESISDLQLKIRDGIEKISMQAVELEKLMSEKTQLEETLTTKNQTAAETEKQLEERGAVVTDLTTKLEQEEAKSAGLAKDKADREQDLKEVKEQKGQVEQDLTNLKESFSTQTIRLSSLESMEVKLQKPNKDEL
jgi:chromosome segregation ATPase